jgi:hypothetical protein
MPAKRPCLVPGCECKGWALGMEAYRALGDDQDLVESGRDELPSYCALCGHTEEEHELAAFD